MGNERCHHCGYVLGDGPFRPDDCPRCGTQTPWLHDHCDLCEREIQPATIPLCRLCEASARAHGKLMADARRYPDPEG